MAADRQTERRAAKKKPAKNIKSAGTTAAAVPRTTTTTTHLAGSDLERGDYELARGHSLRQHAARRVGRAHRALGARVRLLQKVAAVLQPIESRVVLVLLEQHLHYYYFYFFDRISYFYSKNRWPNRFVRSFVRSFVPQFRIIIRRTWRITRRAHATSARDECTRRVHTQRNARTNAY